VLPLCPAPAASVEGGVSFGVAGRFAVEPALGEVVAVEPGLGVAVEPGLGVAVEPALGEVVAVEPGASVAVEPALGEAVGVGDALGLELDLALGDAVGLAVGLAVGVGVGGGGMGVEHVDFVMVLVSSVTAPLRASVRPSTVTPVVTVIELNARMVPRKMELVPRVAELPTCQKTLQDWAPPMRFTWLLDAVVSVDPAWKMKTAVESPPPLSVRSPVSPSDDAEL
jgi:hypothetical protein